MICLKCFSLNIYPKKEITDSHKLNSNKTRSQAKCGDEKCILQICERAHLKEPHHQRKAVSSCFCKEITDDYRAP